MKLLFLLCFLLFNVVVPTQNSQQPKSPVQILYGPRDSDPQVKKPRGPLISGILNMKVKSGLLPAYPTKAKDNRIEGTVEVQLLVNEDGEVIFANPLSGPEALWAVAVRASVTARFGPTRLEGEPVKITGRLIYDFKNGKVEMPFQNTIR